VNIFHQRRFLQIKLSLVFSDSQIEPMARRQAIRGKPLIIDSNYLPQAVLHRFLHLPMATFGVAILHEIA
jgi:hypothetical protein